MAVTINSNIAALGIQRVLDLNAKEAGETVQRLSTGMRINRASDDAAGLAVSSSLNTDVRTFTQAVRNVNDGVSALSVAEQALSQLSSIVIRQQELATQAANGVFSLEQRRAIDAEAKALTDEYNRIVATTSFNGTALLQPSTQFSIQAGVGNDAVLSFGLGEEITGTSYASETGSSDFQLDGGAKETTTFDFYNLMTKESGSFTFFDAGSHDYTHQYIHLYAPGSGQLYSLELNYSGVTSVHGTWGTVGLHADDSAATVASKVASAMSQLGGGGLFACSSFGASAYYTMHGAGSAEDATASFGIPVHIALQGGGIGLGHSFKYVTFNSTAGSGFGFFWNSDGTESPPYVHGISFHSIHFASHTTLYGAVSAAAEYINTMLGSSFTATTDGAKLIIANKLVGNTTDAVASGFPASVPVTIQQGSSGSGFIDPNNDLFTLSNHGLTTGQRVRLSSTGVLPAGLGAGTDYYVIKIDANRIRLADSHEKALGNQYVNFTSRGEGTHTITAFSENEESVESTMVDYVDLSTDNGAKSAMPVLDKRLDSINRELGSIGAGQSRLDTWSRTLTAARESYAAAESRIVDADVAAESAALVRRSILQQAAAAIMGQANRAPELALLLI